MSANRIHTKDLDRVLGGSLQDFKYPQITQITQISFKG